MLKILGNKKILKIKNFFHRIRKTRKLKFKICLIFFYPQTNNTFKNTENLDCYTFKRMISITY